MNVFKKSNRKLIRNSDPGKILDLIANLTDNSCAVIQTKINQYLIEACELETVALIVVLNGGTEAFIEAVGANVLPRKVNICMHEMLSDILKSNQEQIESLSNLEKDIQDIISPYVKEDPKTRVLMHPTVDKPFSVIACAVAPNILQSNHTAQMIYECFLFSWPTLKKAIALEYEHNIKLKCQHLLRVARRLFTQVGSMETLLTITMQQAKQLTKAEYCTVMLVDVDRMELVEKYRLDNIKPQAEKSEVMERRFPMTIGITGHVLNTGTVINAKNAREHPAFNKTIDCIPGVECKTVMCFPIREQTGIIGVGQLINKIGDPYFDTMDEEMALAFSIYCGVCITHAVVYQKVKEAHIRNALANELIMYHMKVGESEVRRVIECTGIHNQPHVETLYFNARILPLRELPCYVVKMFVDLNFLDKFNIKLDVLVRFVLHVKKGYRDVPYHCWMHAFNVAQWAYAAIINFKLTTSGYLTDLQALTYLLAALVHDIDHRGTTNSFQIQGQTTLAALYSSEGSVMERHHIAQAMAVLNAPGCEILESLPRRDYDRAIVTLRDLILATDLANYFKNFNEYKTISHVYQKNNRTHTTALQCLLMNGADLSEQLKEWSCVKKTAAALLTEFFKQGDVEKMRGDLPVSIMDREKCFIPELQIQFLVTTCIPLYDILGRILPKANGCSKIIESHIEKWEASKSIFAEVPATAGLSVLLSPNLDELIHENMREGRSKEQDNERRTTQDRRKTTEIKRTTEKRQTIPLDNRRTTEKPQTKSEYVKTTTKEPQTLSEDVKKTTEEPQTTSEDEKTTTEEPQITSEDVKTTTEEPQTTSEDAKTTTEEPLTTS